MPPAEGEVDIATTGSDTLRSPYAKHNFVGGNAYMLDILKNFGGELGVQADTTHFDASIERTLTQLQSEAVTIAITEPTLADTTLSFDVTITTLTGHKFPTGYPSRRAWIQVKIKNSINIFLEELKKVIIKNHPILYNLRSTIDKFLLWQCRHCSNIRNNQLWIISMNV